MPWLTLYHWDCRRRSRTRRLGQPPDGPAVRRLRRGRPRGAAGQHQPLDDIQRATVLVAPRVRERGARAGAPGTARGPGRRASPAPGARTGGQALTRAGCQGNRHHAEPHQRRAPRPQRSGGPGGRPPDRYVLWEPHVPGPGPAPGCCSADLLRDVEGAGPRGCHSGRGTWRPSANPSISWGSTTITTTTSGGTRAARRANRPPYFRPISRSPPRSWAANTWSFPSRNLPRTAMGWEVNPQGLAAYC